MAFMIYDVCDLKRESFFHTCVHLNEALITLFHIHEAAHMRDHATAYESDRGIAPWEFSLVPFLCFLLSFFATQMTYRAIGPPLCKTGQMKTTYWPFLGDCWEKVWGRGVDDSADGALSLSLSLRVWPSQRSDGTPATHSVPLPSM